MLSGHCSTLPESSDLMSVLPSCLLFGAWGEGGGIWLATCDQGDPFWNSALKESHKRVDALVTQNNCVTAFAKPIEWMELRWLWSCSEQAKYYISFRSEGVSLGRTEWLTLLLSNFLLAEALKDNPKVRRKHGHRALNSNLQIKGFY